MSHYRNAENLVADGQAAKAEAEYKLALEAEPTSPVITFALAKYYVNQQRMDDAIVYFNKFLDLTKKAPLMYDYDKERNEAQFYVDKYDKNKKDADKEKKQSGEDDEYGGGSGSGSGSGSGGGGKAENPYGKYGY